MEFELLKRIVEAALLAAGNPLTTTQLLALFGDNEATSHDDIARAIESLQADSASRGIELIEVASGFRYQVRQDVHAWVARLWTERPSRYSRALLETLALIAYRQPITRGEIEQIRGVAVSTHIIKTLEEREWIRVVGHRDVPGKPTLFGTTRGFLDYFNLKSLDELPSLGEIRDIDDLDPQLSLGPPSEDALAIAVDNDPQVLAEVVEQLAAIEPQESGVIAADPAPRPAVPAEAASTSPILSASERDADTTEQDA
ncbi:MAG: SMC-Scp complex subunit ScpB [Xanthomonadales bacterium]|nr:SMC-Scp complex subunit ScpB [Xanthomonadales bacterium]